MDTKKFLTGTLVGGIAFFFIGYLFYGVALMGFFAQHSGGGPGKSMEEMVWWALILGNMAQGALLTYIFIKWANISSFAAGASAAATIGLLIGLGMNMIRFATSNAFDLTASLADVGVVAALNGLAGGIIGAVLGMGKKG